MSNTKVLTVSVAGLDEEVSLDVTNDSVLAIAAAVEKSVLFMAVRYLECFGGGASAYEVGVLANINTDAILAFAKNIDSSDVEISDSVLEYAAKDSEGVFHYLDITVGEKLTA